MARLGVRLWGLVLFLVKWLGLMNTLIKGETKGEVLILKKGAWGPTLDLSIGQLAVAASKLWGYIWFQTRKLRR